MKRLLVVAVFLIQIESSMAIDRDSILQYHIDTLKIETTDFKTLFYEITKVATSSEEKLTAFYYWVFKNISFDTDRFNKDATPLNLRDILKYKKGLCSEYANLINEACAQLKVPNVKIEGYVKYYGYKAGRSFKEVNHVWNAIYIEKSWKLIDLLWACGTMENTGPSYTFNKKISRDFFLSEPKKFIDSHFPADPIWQFKYYPYKIEVFTNSIDGIDTSAGRLSFINYKDSITEFLSLSEGQRLIKTGERAYQYNKDNHTTLAINYYNAGVDLVNKKQATAGELNLAKKYFENAKDLCSTSLGLEDLANQCAAGINAIQKKIPNRTK